MCSQWTASTWELHCLETYFQCTAVSQHREVALRAELELEKAAAAEATKDANEAKARTTLPSTVSMALYIMDVT